jgi:hypothetical protein
MEKIKLQWRRNTDQSLTLWVCENNNWIHYRQAKHYKQDVSIGSNNGFATAQAYIKLSKESRVELDYLPTLEQ